MAKQSREQQQTGREKQNTMLKAYGYRWKKTEELTSDQYREMRMSLYDVADNVPPWALLSPLDMPVDKDTILRWLGGNDDVFAFMKEHGFISQGKNEKGVWCITSPNGAALNLRQTLQALEQKRLDEIAKRQMELDKKFEEATRESVQSLQETLDTYGYATNGAYAWGYAMPSVTRLEDGTLEVSTYHTEGEWKEEILQTCEEVISYLYHDGEHRWTPGLWDSGRNEWRPKLNKKEEE